MPTLTQIEAMIKRREADKCHLCKKRQRMSGCDHCAACVDYIASGIHPRTDRVSLHANDNGPTPKQEGFDF